MTANIDAVDELVLSQEDEYAFLSLFVVLYCEFVEHPPGATPVRQQSAPFLYALTESTTDQFSKGNNMSIVSVIVTVTSCSFLHKMFNGPTWLLDDALKMCCYRSRLVFGC